MTFAAAARVRRTLPKRRRSGTPPAARSHAGQWPCAGPGPRRGGGCRPGHHRVPGPAGGARVEQADASGDGTLRIGLILDNTGPQSFLNAPQLAAAKLAVKEINAAGGHKGKPVELLPADRQRGYRSAGQGTRGRQSRRRHRSDGLQPGTRRHRRPVQRQGRHDLPREHRQRAQQLRERRLLLPHLGGRHRPGPRPGQARQGQRRCNHRGCVRGRHLRQGRVQRGGRRGQRVRPRTPCGRRVHARARHRRLLQPRRRRPPTPSCWSPAQAPRAPSPS